MHLGGRDREFRILREYRSLGVYLSFPQSEYLLLSRKLLVGGEVGRGMVLSFCRRSTYAGRVTLLWFAGYVRVSRDVPGITKGKHSDQLQARDCGGRRDEIKSSATDRRFVGEVENYVLEDDGRRTKCRRKTVEVARRRVLGWKWDPGLI